MNEQLIKDLEEVMESNRNARRASDDTLSRVRNALLKSDNDSKKVYERGISAGIDICRDLYDWCDRRDSQSNMSRKDCRLYFNNMFTLSTIFKSFDNDTIIERYKQYKSDKERAEKEEAENKGGFNLDMQKEVFGDHCDYLIQNIILNYKTYKEALAKVEAYEKKKKEEAEQNRIVVGDVVVNEAWAVPFIVTDFENGFIRGVDDKGRYHKYCWPNNLIHKVGSGAGIFDRFKMEKE